MKRIAQLMLSIGIVFLSAKQAEAAKYFIVMPNSCGSWVINQEKDNDLAYQQEDWVLGYLAGIDAGSKAQANTDYYILYGDTPILKEHTVKDKKIVGLKSEIFINELIKNWIGAHELMENKEINKTLQKEEKLIKVMSEKKSVTEHQSNSSGIILSITQFCESNPTFTIREAAAYYYKHHNKVKEQYFSLNLH